MIDEAGFVPPNPDWEERTRRIFGSAPFVTHVGYRLDEVRPGRAASILDLEPHHMQQDGVVHAGVQAAMADHTAGTAAATLLPLDRIVLTVEFKLNLLRTAYGERLICRAGLIKAGRNLSFAEAQIFIVRGGRQTLVSAASVTLAFTPAVRPPSASLRSELS